ncbi:MAG: efflux transporter periplasmic adaptor subunit [Candidatus Rokuibacteriota bacterium]|nr:MAG: efflux transporter periplasmic adaptor subunit [Candidatus Rokubacteria bacterium]PYO07620.1 MAG: efflux transporter periplasmic adaptor subunit [Candidatus Rokubacteria bacterium]
MGHRGGGILARDLLDPRRSPPLPRLDGRHACRPGGEVPSRPHAVRRRSLDCLGSSDDGAGTNDQRQVARSGDTNMSRSRGNVRKVLLARSRWAVLLVAAFGAAALTGCGEKSGASATPPPAAVRVEPVIEKDVPISAEWVGTLVGYVDAQIRARVAGHLVSQAYQEGSLVKTGDLLFQVDPRPFQAALEQADARLRLAESQLSQARAQVTASQAQVEQATASVAQDEAQVKRAEATQRNTELDVARYTPLAQRGSVSQQELDNAVQNNLANLAAVAAARAAVLNSRAKVTQSEAALQKAGADVETQHANIAAARAALDDARLNLGYTRVTSPIDGIAGLRGANIGDFVGPSDATPLTSVSKVDPIYAQFPISEQRALAVFRRWDADPKAPRSIELQLILSDGSVYPTPGRAAVLDRQVDVSTGTVLARGVFPNPGNVLRPGQYAKIRAVVEVKKNAILVPQRAVQDVQGVHQVAVLKADDTVDVRAVQVNERVGSLWVVTQGLKPGERVVVEGGDRVRAGQKVRPEASAPSAPGPTK